MQHSVLLEIWTRFSKSEFTLTNIICFSICLRSHFTEIICKAKLLFNKWKLRLKLDPKGAQLLSIVPKHKWPAFPASLRTMAKMDSDHISKTYSPMAPRERLCILFLLHTQTLNARGLRNKPFFQRAEHPGKGVSLETSWFTKWARRTKVIKSHFQEVKTAVQPLHSSQQLLHLTI